ncbi:MAG TPA: DnaA/Hda family protein [Rhabdochlamydiaceae bacterium]|nr:DnaA/Hda family protein [Rhabdochlamydiaceae bacterium]
MNEWETFLLKQEKTLGKQSVAKWLRSLKIVHFDACNLHLEAEDAFQVSWFEEHFRPLVQAELFNNNHHPIKVHLTVATDKKQSKSKKKRASQEEGIPFFKIEADPLLETATFDTFIAHGKNQTLHQFLTENLNHSGFNPIFIYGAEATGKTHLLMACAHALRAQGIKAFYVHADTFTAHVVRAIRNSQMQEFRKIYRHQQVLLIDDVHLLAKKAATQEELFHTFNTFHTQGRQIILSSQLLPSRLTEIEPRLISRFEWGILFHLEKLQPEELHLLVHHRFKAAQVPIEEELTQFILLLFPKKVKATVEAISKLLSFYKKQPIPLTKERILSCLQELIQKESSSILTPEKIVQLVADQFGIRPADILGKSQTHECTLPRQIAMELCHSKLKMAYLRIGHFFSRDHSTVISGIKQAQKKKNDPHSQAALAFQILENQLDNF